jgi:Cof subfamily protein (haloacid dehalogenase superfamily)
MTGRVNAMVKESSASDEPIAAVLTDVDGTLITKEKVLTERAIDAVTRLRERGVVFCITSGRPPRGLRMFVDPLGLTIAMAAFNGGVIVRPDLSVIDEKVLPVDIPLPVIDSIRRHGLDAWVYTPTEWYVTDLRGTRVDRETSTVQFPPVVVPSYDAVIHEVVKIVGTSADYEAVARCERSIQSEFGTRVSAARSQPYYLDVTHPDANKGAIVRRLARYLNVSPRRIATIGDQMNDTLMFRESGLSIAMGNASADVQRQATFVTTSFGEEGFANAVERFILPRVQLSKAT